jgi:hypothetical protein
VCTRGRATRWGEKIDTEARRKRWQGKSIKELNTTQRSALVADLGAEEFARRLAAEYGP